MGEGECPRKISPTPGVSPAKQASTKENHEIIHEIMNIETVFRNNFVAFGNKIKFLLNIEFTDIDIW
jgi:hypothetical protein